MVVAYVLYHRVGVWEESAEAKVPFTFRGRSTPFVPWSYHCCHIRKIASSEASSAATQLPLVCRRVKPHDFAMRAGSLRRKRAPSPYQIDG